jgi:hypothetical protein
LSSTFTFLILFIKILLCLTFYLKVSFFLSFLVHQTKKQRVC